MPYAKSADIIFVKYKKMKEILTALMIWLGANTPFQTNHELPKVVFLPIEQMEQMFYGDNDYEPDQLHGMYNKEMDTIYLPDDWDRRDPWDLAVLVHEMVHYLQDMNKMEFACSQEMEKMAWPIQQFYLKNVHDYDWEYDQLWFLVVSNCSDPYRF
tara:strand:- start:677 stop:1144 length:468 start_codon:yes stop_codon:yes gene_type:complete